jgi:hypothetical protein
MPSPVEFIAGQILASARPDVAQCTVWRVHWREVAATDWSVSLRTSGRYHRGIDLFPTAETWPALYTSLAPEISIWEMVRRSAARNLSYLRNNVLSEIEVELSRVLDLPVPAAYRLTDSDLTGPDNHLCQEIAAAALARQYEALLVPSAALPGTNLVILPGNLSSPMLLQVVRSTELPLDTLAHEQRAAEDE